MDSDFPGPLQPRSSPSSTNPENSLFLSGSRVLVIGASARAAAQSARQAGHSVDAIDLFGDTDLHDLAERVITVDSLAWPNCEAAISAMLSRLAPDPPPLCLPCGGMEHHEETLAHLAQRTRYLGSNPAGIPRLRDPWELAQWTRQSQLQAPDLRNFSDVPAPLNQWLLKDRSRSGGLGIEWGHRRINRDHNPSSNAIQETTRLGQKVHRQSSQHWQRRVPGYDASVVGWALGQRVHWFGATRQWSGKRELGAPAFLYSGSFGPQALSTDLWSRLTELAQIAVLQAGLQGPFGIDLRLDGPRCWVLEINPRYPAGAEVLERAGGQSLLSWSQHLSENTFPASLSRPANYSAKGILYASRPGPNRVSAGGIEKLTRQLRRYAITLADVPAPGTLVPRQAPILTLLAESPSPRAAVVGFMRVRNLCETLVFAPI